MIKNNLFKDFGAIIDNSVALTLNGQIAVKVNENEYMRYNSETKTMENQMDLVIKEASELIYILPVTSVIVGDIIKNKESYYQILEIEQSSGNLKTVKIKDGSKKTIIKETNILGFSFYYKILSLFSGDGITNTTSNGINPMVLMMLSDKEGEDKDNLLPLMLMSNMNNQSSIANGINNINPMVLMMLSKNKGKTKDSNGFSMKDLMIMQMMGSQSNNSQFNPMMLMMMNDGEMDMKTLMLMNMLNTGNKQSKNDSESE